MKQKAGVGKHMVQGWWWVCTVIRRGLVIMNSNRVWMNRVGY